MVDADEVLWTEETAPTQDGVDALCRSFAQRLAQLLLPPKIGEDLGRALAGIGTNVAGQPGSATRLQGELKRRKSDLTLTLADDGAPLPRPALQAVAAGFPTNLPANLYVPRGTQPSSKVNRFLIRAKTPDAAARPRILVVDDDPVQRLTIEAFLRDIYAAIPCATAAEAELEARLQRPDVIISDIHMPEDDGLAFRDRLAREPALGAVPFLFLTSDRSPGAVAAANETGIDDLIYKPLDKRKLLAVLDRILRRQAQLKALRQRGAAPAASWPETHGRYTIALHRPGTELLLWHRHSANYLQLLACDIGGQADAARHGFLKGAACGLDTGLSPAGFLAAMNRLVGEEGLLDGEGLLGEEGLPGDTGLAATACWLGSEGAIGLANTGLCQAIRVASEGPRPFTGRLAPGERLVLIRGAEPALPPALFARPASAIVETLVEDPSIRSGGRDGFVCVIGFD